MNDNTPTESLVSLPAHDACEPSARVLQRRADDLAYVAPEHLAEKLRAIGYYEPVLPPVERCLVDGCQNMTATGICGECSGAIEQDALDQLKPQKTKSPGTRFWPALIGIVSLLGCIWFTLPLLREALLAAWRWFEVSP